MKSKIYDLMYPFVNDKDGIYELDDLNKYIDKLIEKACIISIIENDKLNGFIAYYANDYESECAFISILMVSPSAPKSGYGRRLGGFCIADLVYRGFKKCIAEVNKTNTASLNTCKKLGFYEAGRKGDYIVLEKMLQ